MMTVSKADAHNLKMRIIGRLQKRVADEPNANIAQGLKVAERIVREEILGASK